jgi:hypothetical protein
MGRASQGGCGVLDEPIGWALDNPCDERSEEPREAAKPAAGEKFEKIVLAFSLLTKNNFL